MESLELQEESLEDSQEDSLEDGEDDKREVDKMNKWPEFTTWLAEVKQVFTLHATGAQGREPFIVLSILESYFAIALPKILD
ncbi:hypothetical protein Ancab_025250 [Ancistrocladus abbreviatus]